MTAHPPLSERAPSAIRASLQNFLVSGANFKTEEEPYKSWMAKMKQDLAVVEKGLAEGKSLELQPTITGMINSISPIVLQLNAAHSQLIEGKDDESFLSTLSHEKHDLQSMLTKMAGHLESLHTLAGRVNSKDTKGMFLG